MQTSILFITNQFFYQPTVDALTRIDPECRTSVVVYHNFEQIPQVYETYAAAYDAVLITGTSAKHVLDLKFPNNPKPVIAYQVDSDGLHRDILRFAIETQNLDFSRIAVDFLIPLGGSFSVVDFLKLEDMEPVILQNNKVTEIVGLQDPRTLENIILEQIVSLWKSNSIDMVLCLYASIVPALQEMGIPFRCPFISDSQLHRVIQEVLMKVEMNSLHNNHPAIVQIFPRHASTASEQQLQQLCQTMTDYIHGNLLDCVIQKNTQCCVLITSMQILRFLTCEFQRCRLVAYLEEQLDFPIAVGYGIGTTVSHAMNNVQIASKEAKLLGKSFIVDTNGNLIGPMDSEKRMVIPSSSMPDVSSIAKQCSLSAMTIQKLLTIIRSSGSDKITTQELAQKLDTTLRNANRIMQNLCKGNIAKPVYSQTTHSRGRPVQVYSLDFNISLLK